MQQTIIYNPYRHGKLNLHQRIVALSKIVELAETVINNGVINDNGALELDPDDVQELEQAINAWKEIN